MSHADKRSVFTDALETLGNIIGPNEKRDAIHLAVEPVIAQEVLNPGEHVNARGRGEKPYVGIVDPFLKDVVQPGERFWLVIYPRKIQSLRHVWSHPAFPDAEEVQHGGPDAHTQQIIDSELWLRTFCAKADCPSYEEVMAKALENSGEEYMHFNGMDAHGEIPDEFWEHVKIVTGVRVNDPPKYFSCAC